MARSAILPYNLSALSVAGGTFPPASGFSGTTAPSVPSSGTAATNSYAWAVLATITGGTVTAVTVNGTQVGSGTGSYWVPAGGTIAITYSSAPTWTWVASGLDAAAGGSTNFAAGWGAAGTGVQFTNNGSVWLWYYNGAQACTAYALIGSKLGGEVFAYTQDSATLVTSGSGWLGPWSPQKYNQTDSSQFTSAPGGVIGSAAVGLTCIDFSDTDSLVVRLVQTAPVLP